MFGFGRKKQKKAPVGGVEEEIDLSSRIDPHIATTFAEGSERVRREDLAPLADAVPTTPPPLVTTAGDSASGSLGATPDPLPEHPLVALADHIVSLGVEAVKGGAPLVPFVVAEDTRGVRTTNRFTAAGTLEEGQEVARASLATDADSLRAGLAWDGYLTLDGERTDAIFVEVHERGQAASVMYAQRYRPGTAVVNFEIVGEPRRVGSGEPLLR